jgi:hypothetical protein
MKTWKWEKGQWLEPRGHRVFRDARDDFKAPEQRAWAIADNSGPTPDQTDDGVLWLDMGRPLHVAIEGEFGKVSIPLRNQRDGMRETRTSTGIEGLVVLRKLFPYWQVTLSDTTRKLLTALAPEAAGLIMAASRGVGFTMPSDGTDAEIDAMREGS